MKTKVAIIGTGGIARYAHVPGYRALDDVEIVAACDIAPGRAREFADEFDIPRAYTDHQEMLSSETLDAVSVCTPNVAHRQPTIDALNAGLDVLCEKPIAMNLSEGRDMVEAARRAGKLLQIGLHFRFAPATQTLKRFVDAGELGDIYYGEATYLRRRGIPNWGVFTHKDLQGGGALIDIGVHVLDHTLWLMGNPKPVSVTGMTYAAFGHRIDVAPPSWGAWDPAKFDVDDMGVSLVRFENGATLILRASWAAHIEKTVDEMRILGTHGGAFMKPLSVFQDKHGVMVDITPKELPTFDPHHKEVEHFVACVRGESECIVVPEQVLDVQSILDAIYESSDTGHEVRLDQ